MWRTLYHDLRIHLLKWIILIMKFVVEDFIEEFVEVSVTCFVEMFVGMFVEMFVEIIYHQFVVKNVVQNVVKNVVKMLWWCCDDVVMKLCRMLWRMCFSLFVEDVMKKCWISCKRKSILIHLVETYWNIRWRVRDNVVKVCDEGFVIMLWKYVMNNLSHKTILMFVKRVCWKFVEIFDEEFAMNNLLTLEWYCESLW